MSSPITMSAVSFVILLAGLLACLFFVPPAAKADLRHDTPALPPTHLPAKKAITLTPSTSAKRFFDMDLDATMSLKD